MALYGTSSSWGGAVGKSRDRGSTGSPRRRVERILRKLFRAQLSLRMELDYRTSFELLVATMLSAQCTDRRVNQVTPHLFRRFRTPLDFARANPRVLERMIRSTGFFKAKSRNLIACARMLSERFKGQVPPVMEDLLSLPGVGRKTANVILGNAFRRPAVVVDTHVKRVSQRLGLTASADPDRIEQDLQQLISPRLWTKGSQTVLLHGRYTCTARIPKCSVCVIFKDCTWKGKNTS